jgi:hypothetical protein
LQGNSDLLDDGLTQDCSVPDKILIRLYGDSVSLPRHAEGVRYLESYGELLASGLRKLLSGTDVYLYNRSYSGPKITDIYETCRSDGFFFGAAGNDIGILQCGIVDCAPRPLPPKVRSIVSRLPATVRDPIVSLVHKNRALMLRSGLIWRVTPPKLFFENFIATLKLASPDFSRVYVINIAPTTPATDARSPGLSESISHYNSLIDKAVCAVAVPNIRVIDVHKLISTQPGRIEDFISRVDGHHISAAAHRLYADAILAHERQYWQS